MKGTADDNATAVRGRSEDDQVLGLRASSLRAPAALHNPLQDLCAAGSKGLSRRCMEASGAYTLGATM